MEPVQAAFKELCTGMTDRHRDCIGSLSVDIERESNGEQLPNKYHQDVIHWLSLSI